MARETSLAVERQWFNLKRSIRHSQHSVPAETPICCRCREGRSNNSPSPWKKTPLLPPIPFDWLQTQLREHKESSVPSFSLVLYHIYCNRWVLINIVLFRWGLGKRVGFVLSLRNYLHMSNNATLLVAHLKPSSVVAVQLFQDNSTFLCNVKNTHIYIPK